MTDNVQDAVKTGYGAVARAGLSSDNQGIKKIAEAFGYSQDELNAIPAEANMGLSCGNPTAMASIKSGETVVDLGSGGGLDVFLAAKQVGPEGRAIGIDMTEDMVKLARKNAAKGGYDNAEFHLAPIENMPLESGTVDCVISNCVLNLVADKDAALKEIYRILKPGGRLAVSDIALKKPLPEEIKDNVTAWVSCISGAISVEDNRDALIRAGFAEVDIVDSHSNLNAYKEGVEGEPCCGPANGEEVAMGCCGPLAAGEDQTVFHKEMAALLEAFDFNEFALSAKIFAWKAA